jgi:hypothetical protein
MPVLTPGPRAAASTGYRLLNWVPRRAPRRPYFFRSFGQFHVEGLEGPGDSQPTGAGLTGRPATIDGDRHLHGIPLAHLLECARHEVPLIHRGEVGLEVAAVDRHLAVARTQTHAGHRRLAAAGGDDLVATPHGTDGLGRARGGSRDGGGLRIGGHDFLWLFWTKILGWDAVWFEMRGLPADGRQTPSLIGSGCWA